MRSKDWTPKLEARVLVISEDANLQWSDRLPDYPHFADYFFRKKPYDHGERSRYMEAKNLFEMVEDLTHFRYRPEEVMVTCLCRESLERPPKGKRTLIPQTLALKGLEHIRWILEQHPTIEVIFVCSMQANYWLQESGLVQDPNQTFLKGSEPRRMGIQNDPPFYQPVQAKAFQEICGIPFSLAEKPEVKIYPLLAIREYPLNEKNKEIFGSRYEAIEQSYQRS